jgi:hypothetical protein
MKPEGKGQKSRFPAVGKKLPLLFQFLYKGMHTVVFVINNHDEKTLFGHFHPIFDTYSIFLLLLSVN